MEEGVKAIPFHKVAP